MTKSLLLCSVLLLFVGSAARAEALPTSPPLFAAEQAVAAPAQACLTQEMSFLNGLATALVPICQGNSCTKTSDCRPAELPECAQCWCLGPAGDKSCGCF